MQMNVKIEKVGKFWKTLKLETHFGTTFKTLIGQGLTKEEARKNAGIRD